MFTMVPLDCIRTIAAGSFIDDDCVHLIYTVSGMNSVVDSDVHFQ